MANWSIAKVAALAATVFLLGSTAAADQVIDDDLIIIDDVIVQGSLCVGPVCVENEELNTVLDWLGSGYFTDGERGEGPGAGGGTGHYAAHHASRRAGCTRSTAP